MGFENQDLFVKKFGIEGNQILEASCRRFKTDIVASDQCCKLLNPFDILYINFANNVFTIEIKQQNGWEVNTFSSDKDSFYYNGQDNTLSITGIFKGAKDEEGKFCIVPNVYVTIFYNFTVRKEAD